MSATVDERVVSMKFDNEQFAKGVQETLKDLKKLNKSIDDSVKNNNGKVLGEMSKNLSAINDKTTEWGSSIDAIGKKFSALGTVADQAIRNMTNKVMSFAHTMVTSFTTKPIEDGFKSYETKMQAYQTTLFNGVDAYGRKLGKSKINSVLANLNEYSDKTIYRLTDMTTALGKFSTAGIDVDTASRAIKGLANEAALAGADTMGFSRALQYGITQALSLGYLGTRDWMSMETAGMATKSFKEELIKAGLAAGTLVKEGDKIKTKSEGTLVTWQNVRSTLQDKWVTNDVLMNTLGKYADTSTELGKKALAAAQEVKTFTQLIDVLGDSLGSAWQRVWQQIIGDYDQAKKLWTSVNNFLQDRLQKPIDNLAKFLEKTNKLGTRTNILYSIKQTVEAIESAIKPIKDAFKDIFPAVTAEQLAKVSRILLVLTNKLKLSAETAQKVKNVFSGIFSAIDIILQSIGAVIKGVFPSLAKIFTGAKKAGGGILDMASNLGSFITAVDKLLKKYHIFDIIAGIISNALVPVFKTLKTVGLVVVLVIFKIISGIQKLIQVIKAFNLADASAQAKQFIANFAAAHPVLAKIASVIFTIGKAVATWISSFTLIGKYINALKSGVNTNDVIGIFEKAHPVISAFIKVIGGIKSAFDGAKAGVEKFGQSIDGMKQKVEGNGFFSKFAAVLKTIGTVIGTVFGAVAPIVVKLVTLVGGGLVNAFNNFAASLSSPNMDKGKTILGAIIALLSGLTIKNIIGNIANLIKNFNDNPIVKGIKGIKDDILGTLEEFQNKLQSEQLMNIAKAIGILAGSLLVLSLIDGDALARALGAISVGLTELMGAMYLLTKLTGASNNKGLENAKNGLTGLLGINTGDISAMATNMIKMAAAMAVLTIPITVLAQQDWNGIAKGLVGVAGGMAILLGTSAILEQIFSKLENAKDITGLTKGMSKATTAMFKMAISVGVLTISIKALAELNWGELVEGLIGAGAGIAMLTTAMLVLTNKSNLFTSGGKLAGMGVAFVGMAVGILAMSHAVSVFAKLPVGNLIVGVIAFAGALTALSFALSKMPVKALAGAGALTLAAPGLLAMAFTLKQIADLNAGDSFQSVITFASALAVLGGVLTLMPIKALAGAGALTLAAPGLLAFAQVIKQFAGMGDAMQGVTNLGNSLIALGAGLDVMIIALPGALALDVASVGIAALGGALLIFDKVKNGFDAAGNLGGSLAVLALGLTFMAASLPGAVALDVASVGITALGGALKIFEKLQDGPTAIGNLGNSILVLAFGLTGMAASLPGAIALTVASGGIAALGGALLIFEKVKNGFDAAGNLGGSLAVLALGLTAMIVSLPGAIALDVAAGGIAALGASLGVFGKIPNGFDAAGNLGGSLAVLALGLTFMAASLPGALALDAASIGINSLAKGLTAFGNIPNGMNAVATFAESLTTLAGGLAVMSFGVAGAIALQIVGNSLIRLAEGVKAFTELTSGGTDAAGLLGYSLEQLGKGLSWMSVSIPGALALDIVGYGLGNLATALKNFESLVNPQETISNLGTALTAMAVGLTSMSFGVAGALVLDIVGAGLNSLANALRQLQNVGDLGTLGGNLGYTLQQLGYGLSYLTLAQAGAISLDIAAAGLKSLASALTTLGNITELSTATTNLGSALESLATGLILMSYAIVGAMALSIAGNGITELATGIQTLNGVDNGATAVKTLGDALTELSIGLQQMVVSLPGALTLSATGSGITALANGLQSINSLGQGGPTVAKTFGDSLKGLADGLYSMDNAIGGAIALSMAADGITALGKALQYFNGAEGSVENIRNTLLNLIECLHGLSVMETAGVSVQLSTIADALSDFSGAAKTASDNATQLTQAFDDIQNKIPQLTASFSGLSEQFRAIGNDVLIGFRNGIYDQWDETIAYVQRWAAAVEEAGRVQLGVHSPSTVFEEIGQWLGVGLGLGIEDGQDSSITATTTMCSGVENAARNALGVHSASTVFKEIGMWIVKGLGIGIEDNTSDPVQAATDAAQQTIDAATQKATEGLSEDKIESILDEKLKGLYDQMKQGGADSGQGIVSGIESQYNAIRRAYGNAGSTAADSYRMSLLKGLRPVMDMLMSWDYAFQASTAAERETINDGASQTSGASQRAEQMSARRGYKLDKKQQAKVKQVEAANKKILDAYDKAMNTKPDTTSGLGDDDSKKGSSGSKSKKDASKALAEYATAIEEFNKRVTPIMNEFAQSFGAMMSRVSDKKPYEVTGQGFELLLREIYKTSDKANEVFEDSDTKGTALQQRANAIREAFTKAFDEISKSVRSSLNFFDEFDKKYSSWVKPEKLVQNAQSQAKALNDANEGVLALAYRGVPDTLIQTLGSDPLKNYDKIMEMNQMTNEQLKEFVKYSREEENMGNKAATNTMVAREVALMQEQYRKKEIKTYDELDSAAQAYYDLQKDLIDVQKKGIDLNQTVYGNIDTNNRQVLKWTDKTLKKYDKALKSWGISGLKAGDYSTVEGGSNEFNGTEIAYTPILNTDKGPIMMDKDTVYSYIERVMDAANEAVQNGEGDLRSNMLAIDAVGFDDIAVDGERIKGIIAGIGDEAAKAGEAMHYVGNVGSIAYATNLLAQAAKDAGTSVDALKQKLSSTVNVSDVAAAEAIANVGNLYATLEQSKGIITKYEEKANTFAESMKSTISGFGSMFSEFSMDFTKTGQDLYDNAMKRVSGLKLMIANIKTLQERGLNNDAIAELASQGPDAIFQAMQLSSSQITELNSTWDEYKDLLEITPDEETKLKKSYTDAAKANVQEYAEAIKNSKEIPQAIQQAFDYWSEAFGKQSAEELDKLGQQTAATIVNSLATELNGGNGSVTSNTIKTAGKNAGTSATQGAAESVVANTDTIKSAVTTVSEGTKETSYKAGYDNGKNYTQGYADGIRDDGADASLKTNAAQDALDAKEATAKAQDSHSPSKVAKELGIYFVQGYADGLKDEKAVGDVEKNATGIVKVVDERVKALNTKGSAQNTTRTYIRGLCDGLLKNIDSLKIAAESTATSLVTTIDKILSTGMKATSYRLEKSVSDLRNKVLAERVLYADAKKQYEDATKADDIAGEDYEARKNRLEYTNSYNKSLLEKTTDDADRAKIQKEIAENDAALAELENSDRKQSYDLEQQIKKNEERSNKIQQQTDEINRQFNKDNADLVKRQKQAEKAADKAQTKVDRITQQINDVVKASGNDMAAAQSKILSLGLPDKLKEANEELTSANKTLNDLNQQVSDAKEPIQERLDDLDEQKSLIDDQNDELNDQKDIIDKNIQAEKDKTSAAKENAETVYNLAKEQKEADEKAYKRAKKIRDANKDYNKYFVPMIERYATTIGNAYGVIGNVDPIENAAAIVENMMSKLVDFDSIISDLESEYDDADIPVEAFTARIQEAFVEVFKEIKDGITDSISLFEAFDKKADNVLKPKDLLKNAKSQLEGNEEFYSMISDLSYRVPESLRDKLYDLGKGGVSNFAEVKSLSQMTNEELEELGKTYTEIQNKSQNWAEDVFKPKLIQSALDMLNKTKKTVGVEVPDDIIDAARTVRNAQKSVKKADDTVDKARDAIKKTSSEITITGEAINGTTASTKEENNEIEILGEKLDDITDKSDDATEQQEKLAEAEKKVTDWCKKQGIGVKDLQKALGAKDAENFLTKMKDLSGVLAKDKADVEAFKTAAEKMATTVSDAVTNALSSPFDEVQAPDEENALTGDKLLTNLQNNVTSATNLLQNFETLLNNGVSHDVITLLASKGAEAVGAATQWTATQIQNANDLVSEMDTLKKRAQEWTKDTVLETLQINGKTWADAIVQLAKDNQIFNSFADQFVTGLSDKLNSEDASSIGDAIYNMINKAGAGTKENYENLSDENGFTLGSDFTTSFGVGITDKTPEATKAATDSALAIMQGFKDNANGDKSADIAYQIVQGMCNGLTSDASIAALSSAGAYVGQTVDSAIRNSLQIHSPSRKAEEIGEYFNQGLVNGLTDTNGVQVASEQMAFEMISTIHNALMLADAILEGQAGFSPTITPVVDMGSVYNAQNAISSMQGNIAALNVGTNMGQIYTPSLGYQQQMAALLAANKPYDDTNVRMSIDNLGQQITAMGEEISNLKIVLDSGTLVGEITPQINTSLSQYLQRKWRL